MKAKASNRIQELHDQLVQRDGEIAELRLQLDEARQKLAMWNILFHEFERVDELKRQVEELEGT